MEVSETKNGKSKTTYIYTICILYITETTELRRTYLCIIQTFEKIVDKDRFT